MAAREEGRILSPDSKSKVAGLEQTADAIEETSEHVKGSAQKLTASTDKMKDARTCLHGRFLTLGFPAAVTGNFDRFPA